MTASSKQAQKGSIPPLRTLTLSGALALLTPTSGSILGATAGSVIVSNIAGLVVDSLARTYTWSGVGVAGPVANGLVETHLMSLPSSANSSLTIV